MASYTWKIDDPALVKKIKTAHWDQSICGDVFTMFGLRWQLDVEPRRKCKNETDKIMTLFFLRLKALSPKIKTVRIHVKYCLLQGDINYSSTDNLSHEEMYGYAWPEAKGILAREIIEKYDAYTYKIDVELLAVHDQNDNDITQQFLENDSNVILNDILAEVQSISKRVDQIEAKLINEQKENNVDMDVVKLNLSKRMDQIEAKLVNEQKEDHMDVVKKDLGKRMDQIARLNEEEMQNLSTRMNQMEKRLNEEQKEDKMESVMNEIKSLKQAVSKLTAKNNDNPKANKLRAWLENKVGYPQYYDLFIENGIEDLSVAKLLTMDTLKGIGVDKIGHCMKILHQVAALNQNQYEEEGGTQFV